MILQRLGRKFIAHKFLNILFEINNFTYFVCKLLLTYSTEMWTVHE